MQWYSELGEHSRLSYLQKVFPEAQMQMHCDGYNLAVHFPLLTHGGFTAHSRAAVQWRVSRELRLKPLTTDRTWFRPSEPIIIHNGAGDDLPIIFLEGERMTSIYVVVPVANSPGRIL
jgi:hypothetical protein